MIMKLTKHGDTLALVIEQPILDQINAGSETTFDVTTDGQRLVLTPVKDERAHDDFKSALDRVNRHHAKDLKKLAE